MSAGAAIADPPCAYPAATGRRAVGDTRPAGVPIESAKDDAEQAMTVDLERNDLPRVPETGSVRCIHLRVEARPLLAAVGAPLPLTATAVA